MATYDEMMAAARKADQAGDAAGAKRLLEMAKELKGSFGAQPTGGVSVDKPAVDDLKNRLTTLGANTANAASFGLGDESVGVRKGVESLISGGDFMPAYREGRDRTRANMGVVNEEYPSMATTGNLVGAAIPAIAAAPAAMGNSMLQTVMRGAGIGAAEGGLQGAGYADGRDLVGETVKGALIGGGVGVAAPALVGAAGAIKNAVKDPLTGIVDALIGRANTGKANRAISGALGGRSQQDIDAALAAARSAGQPEFRMMDALGLPGQRLASGMTRAGGDPAAEIAEYLSTRQAGQGERVGSFVEDAFDVGGTTAAKTREGLVTARGDAADTAYAAARGNAAPVDIRGALGVIDARTKGMAGSGVSGDSIDGKLLGYRERLAAQPGPDGVMRELSDFDRVLGVKQAIQDDIGAAVRAGRNNEARELTKLANELDAALEASSDMYRTANDGFRDASRVIGAVDEGAMMANRGRAADNVPRFQSMTAPQQDAARTGYGDTMLGQLEKITSPTSNRAKPLQSPKRTMEATAMAQDYPLYADRLGRENVMWETQNRALGGSRTADNLADREAVDGLAGGTMDAMRSVANFQIGDAVAKIAALLGPVAKGQNSATRSLIAQALLSGDASVLAPAIAQATKSAKVRRAIEAVIRQPMREGVEASVE
jgi:hypothetical protein